MLKKHSNDVFDKVSKNLVDTVRYCKCLKRDKGVKRKCIKLDQDSI